VINILKYLPWANTRGRILINEKQLSSHEIM
jgi:hypothetical protein